MKQILTWVLMAMSLLAPSYVLADSTVEPSIVIRHDNGDTYYEYTENGIVKEIKVVPKHGPVYYLVPAGQEDEQFKKQTQSKLVVPKWVIFSW